MKQKKIKANLIRMGHINAFSCCGQVFSEKLLIQTKGFFTLPMIYNYCEDFMHIDKNFLFYFQAIFLKNVLKKKGQYLYILCIYNIKTCDSPGKQISKQLNK